MTAKVHTLARLRLPDGPLRMRPGGRLKPHFGGAPRLSAHLALVVPDGELDVKSWKPFQFKYFREESILLVKSGRPMDMLSPFCSPSSQITMANFLNLSS